MKNKLKKIILALKPDANTPKILSQFAIEFSVPAVIAVAWTGWEWYKAESDYELISKAAIHFFAAGWAFTQWNRIKKQKRQEDGLSTVETDVKQLVQRLDESTRRMIGFSTGGDSFCEVIPTPVNPLVPNSFAIMHHGEFPLYDLTIRIVDLRRRDSIGSTADDENIYKFDTLIPDHLMTIGLKSPIDRMDELERRFNIHVSARNGSSVQMLQMKYVNGFLRTASNVEKAGKVIFEDIAIDYPRDDKGEVDWEPHFEKKKFDYKRDII